MKTAQKGFTLVEIAIVLVIIGLLLGGILKGQEMITQAKIKNVIADFSGISAAYHGYQDRYRAIPGDDPNAGDPLDHRARGRSAGNGNGVVAGTYNNACPAVSVAGTPESCMFWDHLRRAGFVAGNGAQQPFNALTGSSACRPATARRRRRGAARRRRRPRLRRPDHVLGQPARQDRHRRRHADGRRRIRQGHRARPDRRPTPNPDVGAVAATAAYAETGTNVYVICRAL